MMVMIPKVLRRILLVAGLLVMAQTMAIGAQAAEKAKPMAPNYEIVDLQKSGLANIRGQANIIHAMHGLADDSLSSYRYVAILVLDGELWGLKQARKQWTCKPGRGHQEWSAQLCR